MKAPAWSCPGDTRIVCAFACVAMCMGQRVHQDLRVFVRRNACACARVCLCVCVYSPFLCSPPRHLLAHLVPLRAHVGLGPLHGRRCRPAGRGPGHEVDEVDLDCVGHAIQGAVHTPHTCRCVVNPERPPSTVPLVPHSQLGGSIALRENQILLGYC
jgi:hypothetical protein